jgi:hypothetical protein
VREKLHVQALKLEKRSPAEAGPLFVRSDKQRSFFRAFCAVLRVFQALSLLLQAPQNDHKVSPELLQ